MNKLIRKMLARISLALGVLKHLVTVPLHGRRVPGPWLERLRGESLAPAPVDLWEYVEGTSRCIGCGLCDLAGEGVESPAAWVLGVAREPSTASLAEGVPLRLRALAAQISTICPARVPTEDIARLLEANQQRLSGDR